MLDKRKDPRKKLMAFTPVYSLNPKSLLGYLEDLTVHGALIVGDVSAEVEQSVTLAIEFPQGVPEVPQTPFVIGGRVARCQRDEAKYFNIGIEFTDAASEQIAIIESIIRRYEFNRSGAD